MPIEILVVSYLIILSVYLLVLTLLVKSSVEGSESVEPVTSPLEAPTKEQLKILKERLRIETGSVQYKDGAIYQVTAQGQKRLWRKLGRWSDLAAQVFSNAATS